MAALGLAFSLWNMCTALNALICVAKNGARKIGWISPCAAITHGIIVLATVQARIYLVALTSPVGSESLVMTNPAFL